ncbi:MAG: hypothetical protein II811_07840, partial [Spirochaetaceae bacterium]|nr:hypothetical protein [Spirochaetaceae bacterium]
MTLAFRRSECSVSPWRNQFGNPNGAFHAGAINSEIRTGHFTLAEVIRKSERGISRWRNQFGNPNGAFHAGG